MSYTLSKIMPANNLINLFKSEVQTGKAFDQGAARRFQKFFQLVKNYFNKKGYSVELVDSEFLLIQKPGNGSLNSGLYKIAAYCAKQEESAWEELITYHFDVLLKTNELVNSEETLSPKQIREKLRLVMYTDQKIDASVHLTEEILCPGFLVTVALDFGEALSLPSADSLEGIGLSGMQIFEMGLSQTLPEIKYEVEELDFQGSRIFGLKSQDPYLATIVYSLESLQEFMGKYGAILLMPANDQLVVYPINGPQVLLDLPDLAELTRTLYDEEPYFLTDQIFWIHDGEVDWQEVWFDEGGEFQFEPTEKFRQLLEQLEKGFDEN